METVQIIGITCTKDLSLININDQKCFNNVSKILKSSKICPTEIYMLNNIACFVLHNTDISQFISNSKKQYIESITNVAIISVVGFGLNNQKSLIFTIISAMTESSLKIISISSSNTKISCTVQGNKIEIAQQILHEKLCISQV